MRKRKFVCGMFALCLALSMAGCGKGSEERQAANYYQNELGLDKEDAEELAHELCGKDEEEKELSVTEEGPKEIVVEPLPELVNSEWYERKVQIYDMVFSYDYCMTEEDIRKIVEGSAYDVELTEDFDENGDVCLNALKVDGEYVAQIKKTNYSSDRSDTLGSIEVKYGLRNEGDYYYGISGYRYYEGSTWYDKASIEFENLKTRDDVLAYLAANGFVEVEKEQATYAAKHYYKFGYATIYPDERPVEYADVPHYYCKGAQSITFFRIHKLGETDQEFQNGRRYYSGAHLNLVNYVTFEFDTDGTIDVSTKFGQYANYAKEANLDSYYPGWYLSGMYCMENFTYRFEIMGEQID